MIRGRALRAATSLLEEEVVAGRWQSWLDVSMMGQLNREIRPTLLLAILHAVLLVHSWAVVGRVAPEGDLERGEELVHAGQEGLWPGKRHSQ